MIIFAVKCTILLQTAAEVQMPALTGLLQTEDANTSCTDKCTAAATHQQYSDQSSIQLSSPRMLCN